MNTITTAALIAATITIPTTAHADNWADTTCHVPVDGEFAPGITITTFAMPDGELGPFTWRTPGAGFTAAHALPCFPTDCPDPYVLSSGGCVSDDPFDHIPFADEPFASLAGDTPHVGSVLDVGPLIEPAIVEVTA